jgi:hypothetical protein
VHLVGFIRRIRHDARSHERKIQRINYWPNATDFGSGAHEEVEYLKDQM